MQQHSNNKQDHKNQAVANAVSQKRSINAVTRPENNNSNAMPPSQLQEMVNNSAQLKSLKTLQEMADSRPLTIQAAQFHKAADHSNRNEQENVLQEKSEPQELWHATPRKQLKAERPPQSSHGQAPVQGKFIFQSTLANGWYDLLKKHSSRLDLFNLVDKNEDLEVTMLAEDNKHNMVNKLGASLGIIYTKDDAFAIPHLTKEENVKKLNDMQQMSIQIHVFGKPLVGPDLEHTKEMSRTVEEQLVTFAHEWHLHVVPYIELYQRIKARQAAADPTLAIDPGEVINGDPHQNYRQIAAFIKTIMNKSTSLIRIRDLQESPQAIDAIIAKLTAALAEQGKKFKWDEDSINTELAKLL